MLQKYDLTIPDLSDGNEHDIYPEISQLRSKCISIVKKSEDDWSKINDDLRSAEKRISEKVFLINEKKKRISTHRSSLNRLIGEEGGFFNVKQCIKEAYQCGECVPDIIPEEFLESISRKVDDKKLDTTKDPVESIERTMRKLKKMMTTRNGTCPCCTKRLENDEEIQTFLQSLKDLPQKIVSTDSARFDEDRLQLKQLETWHKTGKKSI